MNEINETPEQKPEKSPLPLWRRILLGLILLAIAVLCLIIPASYMMGRQLGAEVVKISEAGEPLKFVDLRKVDLNQANATEDAARYYVEALMNVNP